MYQKKRAEFGRQCNFSDRSAQLIADIQPEKGLEKDYIVRNPVDIACQNTKEFSEHEVNTETVTYTTVGINHVEGGWPKDVNPEEVEQVSRFRKKAEKTDTFKHSVLSLSEAMEHAIRQNNAVDIYEDIFENTDAAVEVVDAPVAQPIKVFRDPEDKKRSVTSISWYPDQATKLAAAYSILEFQQAPEGMCMDSYVWNMERPGTPESVLSPSSPLVSVEYNPKDVHMLLGGQYNGQIAVWDVRKGSRPVEVSPIEKSHRDPVYRARFLASKSGTDAFSCSSDGQVLFWDVRKLSEPVETLLIDPDRTGKLLGGVALEYESTMPTKFMVGTEQGSAVLFNRKGKTPEEKISATYPCHLGPVYALERNPYFPKYFLSVGDWSMRVWCEDIKESSVMWTKYNDCQITDALWSPTRSAVCVNATSNGIVNVWDLLFKQSEPTLSLKVSNSSIQSIRMDSSGSYLACGDHDGTITLLELNDALSNMQNGEKPNTASLFERETSREKSVVARVRELRLKAQAEERKKSARATSAKKDEEEGGEQLEEEDPIVSAEKSFWAAIEAEKAKKAKIAARKAAQEEKERQQAAGGDDANGDVAKASGEGGADTSDAGAQPPTDAPAAGDATQEATVGADAAGEGAPADEPSR